MNPVLLSTAYLPPVSWVAQCLRGSVVIEAHEHYVKQSIRNRATICGANGRLDLVVPVDHDGLHSRPITEVRIARDQPWKRLHWKSIESAYRNAPYFDFYEDALKAAFHTDEPMLFQWNLLLLQQVFALLKTDFTPQFTGEYQKTPTGIQDLRHYPGAVQEIPPYSQVFQPRLPFFPDLSVIDLLFNKGRNSGEYLQLLSKSP